MTIIEYVITDCGKDYMDDCDDDEGLLDGWKQDGDHGDGDDGGDDDPLTDNNGKTTNVSVAPMFCTVE